MDMGIETLLYTDIDRDELFKWQDRVLNDNPGKKCLRVDTWTFTEHPTPDGQTFTLYACTMVLAPQSITEQAELRERDKRNYQAQINALKSALSDIAECASRAAS